MKDLFTMDVDSEEYLDEVYQNYFDGSKNALKQRLNINKIILKTCGMDVNPEQLAFITSNKPREIVEACAGSGKTTCTVFKALMHMKYKDIIPEDTVMVTFRHAAKVDMEAKFKSTLNELSALNIQNGGDFGVPHIKTLHALFADILYDYTTYFGIKEIKDKGIYVPSERELEGIMYRAILKLDSSEQSELLNIDNIQKKLHALYCKLLEKHIYDIKEFWSKEDLYKCISSATLSTIYNALEQYKKLKEVEGIVEFSEYADYVLRILKNFPDALERWQIIYSAIFIDEYQDLTQSQVDVFRTLASGKNGSTLLIAIGDGDQSIYKFRGAHQDGCVNFEKDFKTDENTPVALTFSLNRRCPIEILNPARQIIESTKVRRPKELRSDKTGGVFRIKFTEDYVSEADEIIKEISQLSPKELDETLICYRNNKSRRVIKQKLEDLGIRALDSNAPEDLTEKTINEVLRMLYDPANPVVIKTAIGKVLHKDRTFNRITINKVIEDYIKSRGNGGNIKRFYEMPFVEGEKAESRRSKEMNKLYKLSALVRNINNRYGSQAYMSYWFENLFLTLIVPNSILWRDSTSTDGFSVMDANGLVKDEYVATLIDKYSQDITYADFLEREKERLDKLVNSPRRVHLETLHGTKGQEFDRVYIIDLADDVYPAYELKKASLISSDEVQRTDDEAKRLMYVAMTRAKKELTLYFRESKPTRYLSIINGTFNSVDSDIEYELNEYDAFSDLELEFNSEEPKKAESNEPELTNEFINNLNKGSDRFKGWF